MKEIKVKPARTRCGLGRQIEGFNHMAKFKREVAKHLLSRPAYAGSNKAAFIRFIAKYIFEPRHSRTPKGTAELIGGQIKSLNLHMTDEHGAFENIADEHIKASENYANIVVRLMLEYQKRYGENYPLERADKLVRAHQAPRLVMAEPAILPDQALKLLFFLHENREDILAGKTASLPQGLEHHHARVHEIASASTTGERQALLEDFTAQLGRQVSLPRPALPEETS